MLKRTTAPLASVLMLVVALIAVNVLASLWPLSLDITQQRLFTLSEGSRAILRKLQDPVTVKLYVPLSVAEAPVPIKTYARRVQEMLQQYQADSRGKLKLEVYDPKPDSEDEDWANRYGLSPARLPDGSQIYLGLVVLSAGREANIPFLDPRRERFLEYDVSQALTRVNEKSRPKIGILSSLPVYGQPQGFGQTQGEWAFVQELRKTYAVQYLFDTDLHEVPDDLSLVLVIHPHALSDQALYGLDQYVLRGGKMIVLADPFVRLQENPGGGISSSDFSRLFKAWGVDFDASHVVADQQLATQVTTPNAGVVSYPVWLSLTGSNLNRELVFTSQLDTVTLIDAGAISLDAKSPLKMVPVFTSSKDSGLIDLPTVRFSQPLDLAKALKPDGKTRVLGALLTGSVPTAFPDGPPPPPKAAPGQKAEPPKPYTHPRLTQSEKPSSILVVGDADFIGDRFSVQQTNFFGNVISQPLNDNIAFLLNAIEYLTGSQDLIAIRSRGQGSRPFTRLAAMRLRAAQQYQLQENLLSQRLEQVKKRLQELENQKQEGQKLVLTPAQLKEVSQFRVEELSVREQLRRVRRLLRQDIETLGNVLLTINLLAMPLLVTFGGFFVILRRSRHRGGRA